MNPNVTWAIFKRNLKSYFSNPTGYAFICVFVVLSAVAAFCPNEFFNANLANFDQLNRMIPLLLLLFIPAITMGIWSEERRDGTDELLLTMPAADIDVVLGKYFGALAIYTGSLLFSVTNIFVLSQLGKPDLWIIVSNYFGYWLIGVAMIAVGMVASFLTRNLTVAFILGMLFNAPFVAAAYGDLIVRDPKIAAKVEPYSISSKFLDFGNGVITLSGAMYFIGIAIVSLYLAMVLIGRRHWAGSSHVRDSDSSKVLGLLPKIAIGLLLLGGLAYVVSSTITAVWRDGMNQSIAVSGISMLLGWLVLLIVAVWFIQQNGEHYLIRAVSLAVLVGAAIMFFTHYDLRVDISGDQLSSLSPRTRELLAALKSKQGTVGEEDVTPAAFPSSSTLSSLDGAYVGTRLKFTTGALKDKSRKVSGYRGAEKRFEFANPFESAPKPGDEFILERSPVLIEAFITPDVPKDYVETRLNLLNMLREIEAASGGTVRVIRHNTEQLSPEAAIANDQYNIGSRQVQTTSRGSLEVKNVFMGVAVVSGLQKVVIPFVDRGVPVEYELVRSIATVSQQQKKKIGVVTTDVQLFGSFDPQTFQPIRNQAIVDELQKQYELVQIDLQPKDPADKAKDEQLFKEELASLDALMVVQPSTLAPEQLPRLMKAIHTGLPTAVFEDPLPFFDPNVPGSQASFPRANRQPGMGGMFGGMQPPPPKADITELWRFLKIAGPYSQIVYQQYNPYPMYPFDPEFVFIGQGAGSEGYVPFNIEDNVTHELNQILAVYPGSVGRISSAKEMEFTPLLRTGTRTGYVAADDVVEQDPLGRGRSLKQERRKHETHEEYILAARIKGPVTELIMQMADDESTAAATGDSTAAKAPASDALPVKPRKEGEANVVVVCDIDILYSVFFSLRERGRDPNSDIFFDLDNVTFILNVLDDLAGDDRFIEIRNRRRSHRTLETIEKRESAAREAEQGQINKYREKIEEEYEKKQAELDKLVAEIDKEPGDQLYKMQKKSIAQQQANLQLQALGDKHKLDLDRERTRIARDRELSIREAQALVKLAAVGVAPLIPLCIGLCVFLWRKSRETEGVSRSRLL